MKEIIEQAVKVLAGGGVILYPTDTVWGLGCDATNSAAVAKVFAIKRRSESKSLVLLACDLDMVARYIREIPSIAIDLVEVNDAPMTIVYPGAQGLAPEVVAEDGSVGIRIPRHDFCVELVRRLRRPLVSTSANISGEAAPAKYSEIAPEILSAVDWCAPRRFEAGATGRASQIIKLGLKGEVEIIRK
ncbi:MAG: threonylcarbamoyl-AMP synthase [Bacteroidales bacterium]|nr:threonylcarbamoyl-AMP synthase [Bacteroidales bacterium]